MSTLSQQMYWVCSDVLSLILQLRNSQDLPAPDILQRRVLGLFQTMMDNGKDAQIPEQDMNDVKFALSAFADEVIFDSSWPGRTQWLNNPLQLQFFNTNNAGEEFFGRLDMLHAQQGRDHVTQVFFLCLSLGFQGKFRLQGGMEQLAMVVDGVGNHVAARIGGGDALAPNAARSDGGSGAVRRELPYVVLALVFFVLALLIVIVLSLVISSSADDVASKIQQLIKG
ncbi:MAG: DotU family type IV/VI secretion system protein [Myxococcota bacterium]